MEKDMKIYLVGGAVRDELLGKQVADLDYVVVNSTPSQMIEMGYSDVGNDFPVFLHPETKDEYALARTERKNGNGYTGFDTDWEGVTLEDDLLRRDLTINAMAKAEDGSIIDPFNGQDDLNKKVLRHVSEAFKEDPLRILRVARFSAKMPEFTVAKETMSFMQEMVKEGMIDHLTAERVWKEWYRAMQAEAPHRFFEVLKETGALQVLFPVLQKMEDIPQRADYHAEGNVFIHTMMVLKEATELTKEVDDDTKLLVRMGALLHDIGKTETPTEHLYYEDGRMKGSHPNHDSYRVVKPLIEDLKEKYKLPEKIYRFCLDVSVFHQRFHGVGKIKKLKGWVSLFETLKLRQKADERGEEYYFNNLMTVCTADARGRLMTVDNAIVPAPKEYKNKDIIAEKLNDYNNAVKMVGKFIVFAQKNKVKINPKEIKEKIILLGMENEDFNDVLRLGLTKEQRNILRNKGVDIPVTAKERKKNEKRKAIEERKRLRNS